MSSALLRRWGALAGVLGGLLWIGYAVSIALMPPGCIGAECDLPGRSFRDTTAAAPLLIGAIVLIGISLAAVARHAQETTGLGRAGRIGLVTASLGLALLVLGGLTQALLFGGDFPYMPLFVLPGFLAFIVGFLLLGATVLKAGILPRWTAIHLIIGTIVMLGFNDQNTQALLAIPFGAAWVAVGYVLASGGGKGPA